MGSSLQPTIFKSQDSPLPLSFLLLLLLLLLPHLKPNHLTKPIEAQHPLNTTTVPPPLSTPPHPPPALTYSHYNSHIILSITSSPRPTPFQP